MKVQMAGILRHSMVNGPGVRLVFFFQGCLHHCKGCQNPETWDPKGGQEQDLEELIRIVKDTKYLDGITLSGGDPLCQPEAAAALAKAAREKGLSVWCYTGWTWEELRDGAAPKAVAEEVLPLLDILVDGPFIMEKKSEECIYRGSTNQRLIDVPGTLKAGNIILYNA